MKARSRIMVVDDHAEMVDLLADELRDVGFDIASANSVREAVAQLDVRPADLVLTDLRMRGADGFDLLDHVRESSPDTPVILMTAFGGVDAAVEAMKRGAYHYVSKPFKTDEVIVLIRRALETRRLRAENERLKTAIGERSEIDAIVGASAPMVQLRERTLRLAAVDAPVLIRGESGTGKELVARALHFCGPRAARAFVALNCTAIPRDLLESELFGHLRGAFTGATGVRKGLFVEADGGTLFLDEVGDMPLELQAKLLRVLQAGEVRAIGSNEVQHVDVRVIAATHQPLEQRVTEGTFREDLLYRLDVLPLQVPSLAERREDIGLLVEHFVAGLRRRYPIYADRRLPAEVVARLYERPWPGNVRELENVVQRMFLLGDEEDTARGARAAAFDTEPEVLLPLHEIEQRYIGWVLDRCGNNKTRAAEILGLDPSTLHRRLK